MKLRCASALAAVLALASALPLQGQTAAATGAAPAVSAVSAPTGFRDISVGMSLDDVKSRLRTDPLFFYRGEPDVSLVPQTTQTLIECAGTSYISRAYFQFEKGRLFIMILVLDRARLDYYGMFTALSRKYGPPSSLNPDQAVWLFESVRFSLERPLTVKYVDRKTFDALQKEGAVQTDLEQMSREKFIEQF